MHLLGDSYNKECQTKDKSSTGCWVSLPGTWMSESMAV